MALPPFIPRFSVAQPGASRGLLRRLAGLYGVLIAFNLGAWLWAFIAFAHHPLLIGMGVSVYLLGLRHAVDADHIAAIDNTTRKLMQAGQRPLSVGLMFSLGHSTFVVLVSAVIAATAVALESWPHFIRETGALVGTLVSTLFLFAIALINLVILRSLVRTFGRMRRGDGYSDEDMDLLLANRGFLARLFRPLFRLVTRPWHMYFLGFLFGLGFDTATEIGGFGITAATATQGLPIWSIMVFPALFTAGMTLVDTTDSIMMTGAYGWAFVKPMRKLYYNITITAISALVAVLIGGVEGLGLIGDEFHLKGGFWALIGEINDHFDWLGYTVIGVLAAGWLLSVVVYRWKRFDDAGDGPKPNPARLRRAE